MVVCAIAVNCKIRAAPKKTRPSAISLKWRSSLPLAAKAQGIHLLPPEVRSVAAFRDLEFLQEGFRVFAGQLGWLLLVAFDDVRVSDAGSLAVEARFA